MSTFPILEDMPLFKSLSSEQLAELMRSASQVHLPSGTPLFRLGDDADRLFVVRKGRVELSMPMQIGNQQMDAFLEELGPGDMLGWSALVEPHRYTVSASAHVDAELTAWNGADLRRLIATDPRLGVPLLQNLATLICRRFHGMQAMWLRELQRTISARIG